MARTAEGNSWFFQPIKKWYIRNIRIFPIYIYEIENVNVKTIPAEFLSGHLLTLKLKLDPSWFITFFICFLCFLSYKTVILQNCKITKKKKKKC